jgi:hypothetical protein
VSSGADRAADAAHAACACAEAESAPAAWADGPLATMVITPLTLWRRPSRSAEPSQLSIHERPRMELISIAAATSVYAPVALALDVCVEDSHLVGLFAHGRARRVAVGVDPLGRPSLHPLAYRTAEPSKQFCVLLNRPKASLL